MVKVLVIDNSATHREQMAGKLNSLGNNANTVNAGTIEAVVMEAKRILNPVLNGQEPPYDILILDMQLDDSDLGGAVVYEKLVENGYRDCWDNVLVVTIWAEGRGLEKSKLVDDFLNKYQISADNLLPKIARRTENLIKRISELYP